MEKRACIGGLGLPEIVVENLAKSFGNLKVLDGVSFTLERGEFLCIVGPSGCGKTTLVRILAGLERPYEGLVLIKGKPPSPREHNLGYVPQDDALFPWKTVLKNVSFGLEIKGFKSSDAISRAKKVLELVGLRGFENYYPHQLSRGMRKRVALARAFAIDPDILLMDEPFVNLDAQTRWIMHKELFEIWSTLKKTVVFVTHNVEEALFFANKILMLTKRPARNKLLFDVNLPYPRNKLSSDFVNYREKIIGYLREEVPEI